MTGIASIRSAAMGMEPIEAIHYLLAVIEDVVPGLSEEPHQIDSWGVHFPKAPRLMLAAMYDSPGVVSNDRLYQIITAHRTGDLPEASVIKVYIKRLRELVPAERGRIVTYWGRGYGFEKAEAGNV